MSDASRRYSSLSKRSKVPKDWQELENDPDLSPEEDEINTTSKRMSLGRNRDGTAENEHRNRHRNNGDHHHAKEEDSGDRRRNVSTVSVVGKVPEMYLQLLSDVDNEHSVNSTIGQLPVFANRYLLFGIDPEKVPTVKRKFSFYTNSTASRHSSLERDGSQPRKARTRSKSVGRDSTTSTEDGAGTQIQKPYPHHGKGDDFAMSLDKFTEALVTLKLRMQKHGGFYNVASTYFLLSYSGHGFRHLFLPISLFRKLVWLALLVFFMYCMVHLSWLSVADFLRFPKSVSISIVDDEVAEFPAVTICNFNMLSQSKLSYEARQNRQNFPRRLEDVLNLQNRFEKKLKRPEDGSMDFTGICTENYLEWQSPSLKVAPIKQPWPFLAEEDQWDAVVLEVKKARLRQLLASRQQKPGVPPGDPFLLPFPTPSPRRAPPGVAGTSWNPCKLMDKFGVRNGFSVKQAKVKRWEFETGYRFSEEFALPAPARVFNCSDDGETLFGFNDTALAEICGKALYDPTSNRPCLTSYFNSSGVPYNVTCFQLNRICDGANECGPEDGTDEDLYCDQDTKAPKCDLVQNLNSCGNGMCYESSLQCDGFEDCVDGTDEQHCEGLKFDKNCNCYVYCENRTMTGHEECYRLSPFDGVYDGNVEKVMWRSKTAGDFSDVSSLLAPTPEEIRKFGVRGQDFIVSCSFDGVPCSYKDFYKWQNEEFGNCFTFNSPMLANVTGEPDKVYTTAKYGYTNGLRLSLNIELDDYLAAVTPTQGARLLIHDRRHVPFPADNGIDLSPLVETAVMVKRTHILRVPSPHGKCDQSNEEKWTRHFNASYSSLACNELCRERLIRKRCECSKSLNPAFMEHERQLCGLANRAQRTCVDETIRLFQKGDPEVREQAGPGCGYCAPACDEWVFEPTTSGTVKNKMFEFIFSSINKVFLTDDFCHSDSVGSGTVHAHVHFDTLFREEIVESASLSFQQLVSNIGGIWGLYAGFSIITFVEWVELFFNYFIHTADRAKDKIARAKIEQSEREAEDQQLNDPMSNLSTYC